MQQQRRNKIVGIAATIIFHGVLLYLLLCWGYQKPFPPPGEEGILISFGNTPTGRGAEQPAVAQPVRPAPPPSAQREQQSHLTQDFEDAPAIRQPRRRRTVKNDKKQNEKTAEQQPEQIPQPEKPVEKPREVNRSALFPGKGAATSEGQGSSSTVGNQGIPTGEASGSSTGTGFGSVGKGVNLEGREPIELPAPEYREQQGGQVVVNITVDRDGNVINATLTQRGTTVMDEVLVNAALRAARRAKFTPSSDRDRQTGTITYVFKLGQ